MAWPSCAHGGAGPPPSTGHSPPATDPADASSLPAALLQAAMEAAVAVAVLAVQKGPEVLEAALLGPDPDQVP